MASPDPRPQSALPSVRARVLAFASIVVAGAAGALIGGRFVALQCTGACATSSGVAAIVGAVLAASGVAVVASLTLRAMGEWRRISDKQLANQAARTPDDEPGERAVPDPEDQLGRSKRNPSA